MAPTNLIAAGVSRTGSSYRIKIIHEKRSGLWPDPITIFLRR